MVICPHCQAQNAEGARFCGACGKATQSTHPTSDPHIQAEPPSLVGREIAGRFRILAKLGEGGMGAVYRAEQTSLKRVVALKVLRPEVANSPLLVRRFTAEAEAVAKLSHPNTVGIYDYGQDADGTVFISMEFIEGRSLRAIVHTEAPLPIRRTLAIILQVCASLIDAHGHNIVHRDLKPDNVMLQDRGRARDVVRVLDFGIAKLRDDSRQSQMAMTQAGDMLGTPQYMAPEQIKGEHIDGRADIYSLGCMLYELVTARLPYDAPNVMALLSKHLMEQVTAPSQRRPDLMIPRAIDDLVLSAMSKRPADRPATMEEFAERVAAVLASLPPETVGSQVMGNVNGAIPTPAHAPMAYAHSPAPGYGTPGVAVPVPTPAANFPPPPMPPPAVGFSASPAVAAGPGPVPSPVATPPAAPNRTVLWIVIAVAFIAAMAGIGWYLQRDVKQPTADPSDPWSKTEDPKSPDVEETEVEETEVEDPPEPMAAVTPAAPISNGAVAAANGSSAAPSFVVPNIDMEAYGDYMQQAQAMMQELGKGGAAVRFKPATGWQTFTVSGMQYAQRMEPPLTMSVAPKVMLAGIAAAGGTVETVEILGAPRRVTFVPDMEGYVIEMSGDGYDFALLVIGELTASALVPLVEELVQLPPGQP